jgi:hypothetical protein
MQEYGLESRGRTKLWGGFKNFDELVSMVNKGSKMDAACGSHNFELGRRAQCCVLPKVLTSGKWKPWTLKGGVAKSKLEFIIVATWAWENYLGLNVVIMQKGGWVGRWILGARNEH